MLKRRNDLCYYLDYLMMICLMIFLKWTICPVFGKHEKMWMKTDVKEKDGSYELDMDLPRI